MSNETVITTPEGRETDCPIGIVGKSQIFTIDYSLSFTSCSDIVIRGGVPVLVYRFCLDVKREAGCPLHCSVIYLDHTYVFPRFCALCHSSSVSEIAGPYKVFIRDTLFVKTLTFGILIDLLSAIGN